jgi:3-hydroxymyristoyl/3-hydroxydecanoyl-(acyl carrier protein) dehydratase
VDAERRLGVRAPLEHPCYTGHFPGRPTVPAVLILQWATDAARAHFALPPPRGVTQAKFLAPITPGAECALALVRTAQGVDFWLESAGAVAAQGSIEFEI